MLDSDDGGITWTGARDATDVHEEVHGMAVELPDGRLVLIHVHRLPRLRGGERAKISRDGGLNWDPQEYYLNATPASPGYSANCVLPPHLADGKEGMILSVLGERSEGNWALEKPEWLTHMPRMQAVRWRPLDA